MIDEEEKEDLRKDEEEKVELGKRKEREYDSKD